jgi:nicotinamide riboside kinase
LAEQPAIADEQARRIDAAAADHALVIADTTPLMTAVYQRLVYDDRSLDAAALRWQRRCQLTLLTALDLPWQADGLQRDGPQVRAPVDSALRELLGQGELPYAVVTGTGPRRLESALDAIGAALRHLRAPRDGLQRRLQLRDADRAASESAWRWVCKHCDAPDCERAEFRLRRAASLQGD